MSRLAKLAIVTTLVSVATAAPVAKALPSTYSVKVKMADKTGKITLIPFAEITRTNGVVSTKVLPVPQLEALSKTFMTEWNAYKQPASVKITEHHPNNTGMRPVYSPYTFTFTPKDVLFKAAVVREFLEKKGYKALGMSTIDFVVWDASAEYPPGAHDRASTFSNFRKGTTLDYDQSGAYSLFISKPIRPVRSGSEGRKSASDPHTYLATGYDEGEFEVARMILHSDGRIDVTPVTPAEVFASNFGTFSTKEDIEIKTIGDDEYHTWAKRTVPKTSTQLLEAYIIEHLEYYNDYDVTPVIDPQTVR